MLIPLLVLTSAFAREFLLLLPSLRVFLRFAPAPGPLLRFIEDLFPRGITVVVGLGICQRLRSSSNREMSLNTYLSTDAAVRRASGCKITTCLFGH